MRRLFLLTLPGLFLAACADDQTTAPQPVAQQQAPKPKIAPQSFAPGLAEETPPPNEAQLVNDPSAPVDTPLCGSALREGASAGAALYAEGLASGSTCVRNACFEPLTGTFIAADGSRSVCR
ncbi:hypothetical protein AA101099_2254 [Neoasaia chiangmaiensis NBRC 101099]|uniref:Uncharacterized protein n=1 Tax=Neoasaia chiangmaiensis TaxID=320497 RepID=A0A1U9KSJ2_9PROT|nr:hypothetical protein [Neoasaia chiangmaiensis]AQS88796.1 hypothetical protein A0U93_13650 [Neoasaia chiangmaiensis]GBR40746.1 hypothetical protein AA101099_2254 [Neoasaia chiangmaiensis NBRC 101099]GEN13757.1 hypothetical protein NCH01_01880 [Neoasaia chiangmaiensis]